MQNFEICGDLDFRTAAGECTLFPRFTYTISPTTNEEAGIFCCWPSRRTRVSAGIIPVILAIIWELVYKIRASFDFVCTQSCHALKTAWMVMTTKSRTPKARFEGSGSGSPRGS